MRYERVADREGTEANCASKHQHEEGPFDLYFYFSLR